MKLIIDIPKEEYAKTIKGEFNVTIFNKAVLNGTLIPDNATKGDAVETLFSETLDDFCERTTWEWNRWWNAPYQKGGKVE